jgi:hypothetical protein
MQTVAKASKYKKCPACNSSTFSVFFELSDAPIHSCRLWPSRSAAHRCPRSNIKLGFCHDCGFIVNLAFEPLHLEYTQMYENSLHFSPHFQAYVQSLAMRLIKRYKLYGKDIIEIGCGKGEFLSLLCDLGNNRGVGFDPSYDNELANSESAGRVICIRDFYSKQYAGYHGDLICCRQVFEHIQNPRTFLTMLRDTIDSRLKTVVYFEVPNMLFTLRNLSIWDIIYEHCSYFSPNSLARIFTSCGFDVCKLRETYEGQFLSIEAMPGKGMAESIPDLWEGREEMACYVAAFASSCQRKVETWRCNLKRIKGLGRRVIVWGAGARGVNFLNILQTQDQIEYVVDINPRKQGMYIAGTAQQIVPPEFLRDYRPDVVIVMNSIYKHEIQQLVRNLGLTIEFLYA